MSGVAKHSSTRERGKKKFFPCVTVNYRKTGRCVCCELGEVVAWREKNGEARGKEGRGKGEEEEDECPEYSSNSASVNSIRRRGSHAVDVVFNGSWRN